MGFSSPASHPRITKAEREYIETTINASQPTHEKVTAGTLALVLVFDHRPQIPPAFGRKKILILDGIEVLTDRS